MPPRRELIWTREMVTHFWDFERGRPENFFSFQLGAVLERKFRRYFPDDASVVDYGAGNGFLLENLLAKGTRCGAVEFGNEAVAELNGRFGAHHAFLGAKPIEALDEWHEKFDAACLIEVIEHLYDDDLFSTLSCLRSLLKPGGVLIVTTPNEEDRSQSFISSPESGLLFHRYQHVRSWSAPTLRAMLDGQGFKCMETRATDFGASVLAMRRTKSLPLRVARSLAKHLARKRPHLYAIAKRI